MKLLFALGFIGILLALAAAGVYMLRNGRAEQRSANMARSLAWRVGLSVTLFIGLWVAHALGWIQPTGLPVGQ